MGNAARHEEKDDPFGSGREMRLAFAQRITAVDQQLLKNARKQQRRSGRGANEFSAGGLQRFHQDQSTKRNSLLAITIRAAAAHFSCSLPG